MAIEKSGRGHRLINFSSNWSEFGHELRSESDRAAVILAAAKLDELLRMAITGRLLPCSSSQDNLFRPEGPLGSFSAKIDLAHRLGIIDAEFARGLHLVRKIRNEFAHESLGAKLSSGTHSARVRELILPMRKSIEALDTKAKITRTKKGSQRNDFELAAIYLMIELDCIVEHDVRLTPLSPEILASCVRPS